MTEQRDKLPPDEIARRSARFFGEKVERVTAPGGRGRDSLRVHFADRSVIATQRAHAGRMRLEIEVLSRLTRAAAPVPRYLGGDGRVIFQEDAGRRRLSGVLARAGDAEGEVLKSTLASLVAIQRAGAETGLAAVVPPLGLDDGWIRGLLKTPAALGAKLGVASPGLATDILADRLAVSTPRFLKWDVRPGNAVVGDDGRVIWFDWEHCGARHGMEDFAWLAGDEFFPFGAPAVVSGLGAVLEPARAVADIDYLSLFLPFHVVQRLAIIYARYVQHGWSDPENAMRHDRIGVDAGLARRLCGHGAGWADRLAPTRPMVRWFEEVSAALAAL